jgi:hypothetical protein
MLRPEEREGKELTNGVIRVRLYVNLHDVVGIFMVAGGETMALYDPTDK